MDDLRSNFTPGTTRWAVRRAQWKALGHTDEDLLKPKIAVVNTSSSLSVCFSHLDRVSLVVQEAIRTAGGLPFEIRTTAPSDFVTSAGKQARYLMPTRDLIVNDIEAVVEGAELDAMVCLSSCDKTTPAHLMAAVRLNVPTVLVIGGYQVGGVHNGCSVDIDTVYESVGAVAAGTMGVDELAAMADNAIRGPGVCAGLGTANSMHILAEALGMTMPGSAPIRAGSPSMTERARAAGDRIVGMVAEGLTPRRIVTPRAIENAVEVALAVGASLNCVRHLAAVAAEADLDVDVVRLVEQRAADARLVCRVRPNGQHDVPDLDAAGGAAAIMHTILPRMNADALTVTGRTVGETVADRNPTSDVIRPSAAPYPGLVILRGTLAPDGAIVKRAAVASNAGRFTGPARVFATEQLAIDALGTGDIQPGDVIVLRGMGPRGGPGTVFAASFVAALAGTGLAGQVAVVTDGELSGLNHGIVVGQVMPEAADGGPLAGVMPGDRVTIDLTAMRLDVEPVREAIGLPPGPTTNGERGLLAQYARLVGPIQRGATLRQPLWIRTDSS